MTILVSIAGLLVLVIGAAIAVNLYALPRPRLFGFEVVRHDD